MWFCTYLFVLLSSVAASPEQACRAADGDDSSLLQQHRSNDNIAHPHGEQSITLLAEGGDEQSSTLLAEGDGEQSSTLVTEGDGESGSALTTESGGENGSALFSMGTGGSFTPNVGCRGKIKVHGIYGKTHDSCGGYFESEVDNIYGHWSNKMQPPSHQWFMVQHARRRRQHWYCSNTKESHDCGGGNCMRVDHQSRRRFPVQCGTCTCLPPSATFSEVCLESVFRFQGGAAGSANYTIEYKSGLTKQTFQEQSTITTTAASASASMDTMVPKIATQFGLSAEVSHQVVSEFRQGYSLATTVEATEKQSIFVKMSKPVYIYHARNKIYFEDSSVAFMGSRGFVQMTKPVTRACVRVWPR